jgi:hypothetical protein
MLKILKCEVQDYVYVRTLHKLGLHTVAFFTLLKWLPNPYCTISCCGDFEGKKDTASG